MIQKLQYHELTIPRLWFDNNKKKNEFETFNVVIKINYNSYIYV